MAAAKRNSDKNYRDAKTGQFITADEAKRRPDTTVSERRKPKK